MYLCESSLKSGAEESLSCDACSLLVLLDEVGQVALAAIVAIEMHGHEDTRAAHFMRALPAQACDLVVGVHLVELQHSKLDLLALVLDLLWLCVGLLLTLLASTLQLKIEEQSGLVGNAAGTQELSRLQRAATKDQALLALDAMLSSKLRLHAGNVGLWRCIQRQGSTCHITHEELHGYSNPERTW